MSGRSIGSVVGFVIGTYFGAPQLGAMIGGFIGGQVSPDVIKGPSIGDAQQQTAQAGVPRPVVYGHPAPFAGNLIDGESKARKVIVKRRDNGKGSPVITKEEHFLLTSAIRICEGQIAGVARIRRNGKVVADFRADSEIPAYANGDAAARAKAIAEGRASTLKFMKKCRIYNGTETQNPDPALEAIHGVGNTPSYRGTAYMVVQDDDVTDMQGAVAQYQFEVYGAASIDNSKIVSVGNVGGAAGINTGVIDNYVSSGGFRGMNPPPDTAWFYPLSISVLANTPFKCQGIRSRTSQSWRWIVATDPGSKIIYDSGWVCPNSTEAANMASMLLAAPMYSAPITISTSGDGPIAFGSFVGNETGIKHKYMFAGTGSGDGGADIHVYIPLAASLPSSFSTSPDLPGALIGNDGKIYYPSWVTPSSLSVLAKTNITVGYVVSDIASRCGVMSAKIDTTALTQTIPGMLIATQCAGADAIRPIQQMYFFDMPEFDGKLRGILRGGAIAATISDADLVDRDDETTRAQHVEFPATVTVVTRSPEAEYSPLPQTSKRSSSTVTALGETRIESPIPLFATDAMKRADIIQKVLWAQAEGTAEIYLSMQWSKVVPSDCISWRGKRWLVTKAEMAEGVIHYSITNDRASAYSSVATAAPVQGPQLPTGTVTEPTTLVAMQLPAITEADRGQVGIYVVASGLSDNWNGCTVQLSLDNGATVTTVATITQPADIGSVSAISGTDTSATVTLQYGELYSAAQASLDAGANAAAMVNASGYSEVVQYGTVSESPPGTFAVSSIRRGVLDSPITPHAASTQFATLESAIFIPINSAFIGKTVLVRGVSSGADPSSAAWQSITLTDNRIYMGLGIGLGQYLGGQQP